MKAIKKKWGDPIDLEWVDAISESGWKSSSELDKTPPECLCKTRGYFVGMTECMIIVAHTISSGEVIGVQWIPKGMIVREIT